MALLDHTATQKMQLIVFLIMEDIVILTQDINVHL